MLIVIGLLLLGVLLLVLARRDRGINLTREEVASEIETFLDGSGGTWDWDDFLSIKISDPELEAIRQRCADLPYEFPPREAGHYCSPEGAKVLRSIVRELRRDSA